MDKSPDAFRTISEVAEILDTPAHVLRFWETRFPQIKPVKRAGGRRYYRPADVALLTGIRRLLHEDGLTIRDVQKILRDQGVRFVSAQVGAPAEPEGDVEPPMEAAPPPPDNVVSFADRSAMQPAVPEPPVEVDLIPVPPEPHPPEPQSEPPLMPAPRKEVGGVLPGQTSFDFGSPEPAFMPGITPPDVPDTPAESWDEVPITYVAASDDGLYPLADAPTAQASRPWLPARLRALSPDTRKAHVVQLRAMLPRIAALQGRLSDKPTTPRG